MNPPQEPAGSQGAAAQVEGSWCPRHPVPLLWVPAKWDPTAELTHPLP